MKNLLFIFVSIVLFASCSSSKTFHGGSFQKRKYTKGFYFNKKQALPIIQSKLKTVEKAIKMEAEAPFYDATIADTVKITLKNGEIYTGIVSEETDEGVLLQLNDTRTIYLLKNDIAEMTFIKSNKKVAKPHTNEDKRKDEEEGKKNELTFVLKNGKKYQGTISTTVNKSYKIKTISGEHIYVKKKEVKNIYNPNKKTTLHPASKAATVLFFIGILTIPFGLVLLLFGAVFSAIGFKKTEQSPDKYNYKKAKMMKNIYMAIWIIAIALFLLIVFLLAGLI